MDFWHTLLGYEQHKYQAISQDEKKAVLFMLKPKLKWIAVEIFTHALFLQATEQGDSIYPFHTAAFLLLSFSDWSIITKCTKTQHQIANF